jgi:hypothetical protein
MAYFNDNVFDNGLSWVVTNGTRVDICSSEPATYAAATGAASLGNKTGITVGSPEAGDIDGRKVVVPAITDGTVTGTNTATHWALTDGTSVLVATGALSASQAVTEDNTFTLAAFNLTLRDPS